MADEFDQYPQATLIELGKLMLRMSRHDKTRRSTLKAVKTIDPNYQLPGDQQMEDLREELAEKEEKRETERRAAESNARLEKQRAGLADGTLLNGRKFDDATIKEIEEKIMAPNGIASYEIGAKLYLSDFKPPPAQRQPGSATWSFPDIPGLMDDPAKAAREAAHAVIDEFQR